MENERRRHGQRVVPIRITHGIGETTGQYKKNNNPYRTISTVYFSKQANL